MVSWSAQATCDEVENCPEPHSVHVVPVVPVSVSVTEPAAQSMHSLSEAAAYLPAPQLTQPLSACADAPCQPSPAVPQVPWVQQECPMLLQACRLPAAKACQTLAA